MWLGTMLMVAIMANGSSGALSFIGVFKEKLEAMGINMGAAQRLINITSASWDTLPHNSMVITCLTACGMSHKESYKPIFITSVCITLIGLAVAIFLGIVMY